MDFIDVFVPDQCCTYVEKAKTTLQTPDGSCLDLKHAAVIHSSGVRQACVVSPSLC